MSKLTSTKIMMCRVHLRARPVDKTNHKKKNPFASYVNSTFNAGIYLNTWADQENHWFSHEINNLIHYLNIRMQHMVRWGTLAPRAD